MPDPIILGSRSPRRFELLSLLLSAERIRVATPHGEEEAGFDDLSSREAIDRQLASIARTKNEAVAAHFLPEQPAAILTADTIVIGSDQENCSAVLGKPDGPHWQRTVRDWFERYYWNRQHEVVTGVCLRTAEGQLREFQVRTAVSIGPRNDALLEWYLSTEEPLGKAGGYGLQGAGGMFIHSVRGSSSNVIGLPLEQTWQVLRELRLL